MKKVTIVTHNGKFHADEAFAIATLHLLLGKEGIVPDIIRSRDPAVWKTADYLVDVGGEHIPEKNKFDHHQIGKAGVRPNGIPYASFGLVWKKYGEALCGRAAAESIDERLVAGIDANDDGTETVTPIFPSIFPYSISMAVSSFLPTWKDEKASYDSRFVEALAFAKGVLAREVANACANEEAKQRVKNIYETSKEKNLLVFDKHYSESAWSEVLAAFPEVLYIVYPTQENWHVNAVKKELHHFESRKPLPEKWRGLRDGELASLTGVADAVFAHNSGHMAVAKSREGALALAKLAL